MTSKSLATYSPEADIKALVSNVQIHLETARAHVVNSTDTYTVVDQYLGDVIADLKKLESFKELAIRDLKNALDARSNYFNPPINSLKAAKADLKRKQQAWNRRQEQIAAQAQAESVKAAKELDVPAPVIVASTPKGRTKYRDKWVCKVTNFPALVSHISQHKGYVLPGDIDIIDLLAPNERFMRLLAEAIRKEKEVLPGLEIVNDRVPVS
jgi:hypothetical protein